MLARRHLCIIIISFFPQAVHDFVQISVRLRYFKDVMYQPASHFDLDRSVKQKMMERCTGGTKIIPNPSGELYIACLIRPSNI